MKTIKSPFTLYDFFGYLFPGITFCLLSLPCPHFRNICSTFCSSLNSIGLNSNLTILIVNIIVVGYIVGHVIAALSSLILERFIVEKWLKYPTHNLFFSNKVFFFPKFRSAYSEDFQKKFKKEFEEIFKLSFTNPSDIFWCSFEYIALHCQEAYLRSLNFLNLYGFSRNLSMAFLLGGILSFVLHWFIPENKPTVVWPYIIISILTSVFLFWNYLKLLRRLNDEVFRAFYTKAVQKD